VQYHFDRKKLSSVSAKLTARADAFRSVDPSAGSLALLPQENSIFGAVTETYDLLRSPELGESKWIRGAVTLSVQHCLLVRRGKTMRDVKRVLSHEQVRFVSGRSFAEVDV
jgi:prephenate dehydratase